jgi:hypothetical protein
MGIFFLKRIFLKTSCEEIMSLISTTELYATQVKFALAQRPIPLPSYYHETETDHVNHQPNLTDVARACVDVPVVANCHCVRIFILIGQSNMVGHGEVEKKVSFRYFS